MNFSIRGQQIEVTDALRDYVDKKLSRLDKYFDAPHLRWYRHIECRTRFARGRGYNPSYWRCTPR